MDRRKEAFSGGDEPSVPPWVVPAVAGLVAAPGAGLLLTVVGALTLAQRWPGWALPALGIGLWLFTMVVIMPLTSGGFFALALLDGTKAAIGGYLAVALAYSGGLA